MAKGIQCRRVISGGKTSKRLCFIESLLFFCCFLPSDIHLGFASPIPHGELIRFLAQCGRFISMHKGLAGLIGTSLARSGFFSLCFFCSPRYWRGSWVAFRQRLWRSCASLCGLSLFALPPS